MHVHMFHLYANELVLKPAIIHRRTSFDLEIVYLLFCCSVKQVYVIHQSFVASASQPWRRAETLTFSSSKSLLKAPHFGDDQLVRPRPFSPQLLCSHCTAIFAYMTQTWHYFLCTAETMVKYKHNTFSRLSTTLPQVWGRPWLQMTGA